MVQWSIYSVLSDSLLDIARATKNPIVMSFLDLKNVFESVCHQYLFDILQYIKLPSVISYISYQLLFKTVSMCPAVGTLQYFLYTKEFSRVIPYCST